MEGRFKQITALSRFTGRAFSDPWDSKRMRALLSSPLTVDASSNMYVPHTYSDNARVPFANQDPPPLNVDTKAAPGVVAPLV